MPEDTRPLVISVPDPRSLDLIFTPPRSAIVSVLRGGRMHPQRLCDPARCHSEPRALHPRPTGDQR